ncbi:MAG: GNAT family N-acetyltransferase [Roseibium sp.]
MPFTIELANSAYSHEVVAVLHRSITELCEADHANDPGRYAPWLENKTAENVEAWITEAGRCFTAVDETRNVLGVALGRPDGRVLLMYVSPEARYTGVSKALMRALEGYFQDRGLDEVHLMSTKTAEQFYRSLGYSETGDTTIENDMSFRAFKKAI